MFEFGWQRELMADIWRQGEQRGDILETWLSYRANVIPKGVELSDFIDWLHAGKESGYWQITGGRQDRPEIRMPLPRATRFRVIDADEEKSGGSAGRKEGVADLKPLHDTAMAFILRADILRNQFPHQSSSLARQAYELERAAAEAWDVHGTDGAWVGLSVRMRWRAILYCSAASMAWQAGIWDEADEMVSRGLCVVSLSDQMTWRDLMEVRHLIRDRVSRDTL